MFISLSFILWVLWCDCIKSLLVYLLWKNAVYKFINSLKISYIFFLSELILLMGEIFMHLCICMYVHTQNLIKADSIDLHFKIWWSISFCWILYSSDINFEYFIYCVSMGFFFSYINMYTYMLYKFIKSIFLLLQLTYDYKFDFEDDQHKIPCLCGAPNCRKWMN